MPNLVEISFQMRYNIIEVISVTTIANEKKFITISELNDMGMSYYKISQLVKEGTLNKVNRTTYENLLYAGDENDFYSAEAFVPNGVVCLMSAARYYGLTNFLPDTVEVAIERKKRVSTLPEWPEIKLYYFDDKRMTTGVEIIEESGNRFHIFDIEKTVVDIIHYRNKVGIEEMSEILRNYMKRSDRNMDRVFYYARQLRCEKILRTYMEVLM